MRIVFFTISAVEEKQWHILRSQSPSGNAWGLHTNPPKLSTYHFNKPSVSCACEAYPLVVWVWRGPGDACRFSRQSARGFWPIGASLSGSTTRQARSV